MLKDIRDLDVGNVLSLAVSGLSPMTNYYYRVEAYNIVGSSGVSNTTNVTTIKLAQSITFDELGMENPMVTLLFLLEQLQVPDCPSAIQVQMRQ